MRKILCTIPQGTFSREQVLALEASLKQTYASHLGDRERVVVIWCELPPGQGFTERRPSEVSLVMVEVEDGLDAKRREAAMMALATEWARIASVDLEHLMLTLADRSLFDRYLAANRNRVRRRSRPWFLLGTMFHLWRSWSRQGYLSIRANL